MVIGLALVLFGVFVATQFDPIDRLTMVGFSGVCVWLALVIVGTCTAVGNMEFAEGSWLGRSLNVMAETVAPEHYASRPRGAGPLYGFLERILIVVVLPLGFCTAFLQPRRTWPAVLWIVAGLVAAAAGLLVCWVDSDAWS